VDRHWIRGSRLAPRDHAVSDPMDQEARHLIQMQRELLDEKKKHIKQLQKEVERLEEMLASEDALR